MKRVQKAAAMMTALFILSLIGGATDGVNAFESNTGKEALIETSDLKAVIGKYGEICSLKIKSDINDEFCDTEYVLNSENAPNQGESKEHEWMGELILRAERGKELCEIKTSESESREITAENGKVTVSYLKNGISLRETYKKSGDSIRWEIEVENAGDENVKILDLGLPVPFNQYWTPAYVNEELYDTRCVYHSFVGRNSSYIYAARPSGQGKFILFTPVTETGAGFEYRDHWRTNNGHGDSAWAQDQAGYHSGLDVFYIHADKIKETGSAYMDTTNLLLKEGESKVYAFEFTAVGDEDDMRSELYMRGIVDAQAVPSMVTAENMKTAFYLHANDDIKIKNVEVKCVHETKRYQGLDNMVNNNLPCEGKGQAVFREKKIYNGENYYIYDLSMKCLGANDVVVSYESNGIEKETVLQFYMIESIENAIERHSEFMTKHQTDSPGLVGDKTFDDWMMDEKKNRADVVPSYWDMSYWGYGDDWSLTHGTFLAEKNVYSPVKEELEAVDAYLDTAIWKTLMREHQEDFLIHDFLSSEPNLSPTYRGYAYPHIYNTYFSMYKASRLYPDLIEYKESSAEYLMRAYNILKALYSDKVAYNWATGLMGEISTPEIIRALQTEGFIKEADEVSRIMSEKYDNFKNTKYPYGSEYSYDNTGEEAVYTLAKMNNNSEMMEKIDRKTRSCRGSQPVWYHYASPVTICGENWWNFQYTASLAGYCMDDYLRNESNAKESEKAVMQRMNYGGKIANFTCINSGQIDSDPENIGAVSWTYQAELGHDGAQGTGGGKLHNGWRQMAGEADLGLYGAIKIMSSDVAYDPIFGLTGYGCDVMDTGKSYSIIPKDGVFSRLNLINEGVSVELCGSQYSSARVRKDKSEIRLELKSPASFTKIDVSGLDNGKYALYENGKIKATSKGPTAEFTYRPLPKSTVVIRKAPFARDIQPYSPPKIELKREERGKIGKTAGLESASLVDIKTDGGRVLSDGTVKGYVRLPNSFTNVTKDFTLRIKIKPEGIQKPQTRIAEFSDINGRNLSLYFGDDNELCVGIDNTEYKSGVCLPEIFDGELILTQKDTKISLYCGSEKLLEEESEFKLDDMNEVQKNYLGRSVNENLGAFKGEYYDFSFSVFAESIETKKTQAKPLYCEKIVTDGESSLPDSAMVTYSDGFKRKTSIRWGEESNGIIEGMVEGLPVTAVVRKGGYGKNISKGAKVDVSYCAPWESKEALNDGIYTLESSNPSSEDMKRFGTWTRDSKEEWIKYTWPEEREISAVGLVFFDDGAGTRAPVSYNVEYLKDGKWEKAELPLGGGNELKKMNVTTFEKVKTTSLRVVMNKGEYQGLGVLEWEVYEAQ